MFFLRFAVAAWKAKARIDIIGLAKHDSDMKNPNTRCVECDKEFYCLPSTLARGMGRFCSNSCKSKFGRRIQTESGIFKGSGNPQWKGGVWKQNTRLKAKAWNAANPEKVRCHKKVQHEIKMGRLKRSPCISCGAEKVDAHHDDYSKPLDVRWLCRKCHLKLHRS